MLLIFRNVASAEHLPIAAHLALVSLPAVPSSTRFSTSGRRAFMVGPQNNSTAAINNLRRLGARRNEQRAETQRIETQLGAKLEKRGFKVVLNWTPPVEPAGNAGELDVIYGWIVDTSIECDHQRFGGFLKVSLEELLIALNDDRHLLLDPDGLFAQSAPADRAEPHKFDTSCT